jgi:hypothetical protein
MWLRKRRPTLFDKTYYLETYPDVAKAGVDPYRHYISHGVREGRNPNAFFDTAYYLSQTSDRPADPTAHYLAIGVRKALNPHPLFDANWYLAANPDVARAGMNALVHFLRHGQGEGRQPGPAYRRLLSNLSRPPWRPIPGNDTDSWFELQITRQDHGRALPEGSAAIAMYMAPAQRSRFGSMGNSQFQTSLRPEAELVPNTYLIMDHCSAEQVQPSGIEFHYTSATLYSINGDGFVRIAAFEAGRCACVPRH